jgi:dephospho-CoA kinase
MNSYYGRSKIREAKSLKVIAVCGMPGSGKEEFVSIAGEEGLSVVRMGDVVRGEVKSRNLELNSQNVGQIANSEREKHGLGIWAQRTLPHIKGEFVLIDGIRGDAEIEVFRKELRENMILVGISASQKTRFQRIKKRARSDVTVTWESFLERDTREVGWGIENAMKQCEHIIVNEGTLEEFRDNIKWLLRKLKGN